MCLFVFCIICIATTSVFGIGLMRPGNSIWVTPDDNIDEAYNWLASSDRNGDMGTISASNRRTLILTPGTYSDDITIDTNYVDVSEVVEGSTNITGTVTNTASYGYYNADPDQRSLYKTWQATIDVNDSDDVLDYDFDNTASDSNAQTIKIGDGVIPAYGQIVSYMIVTNEAIVTSGSDEDVLIKLGTSDGGTELMSVSGANDLDAVDDILATSAGESPEVDPSASAQDIWIEGDPDGVDWDTYEAGEWQVFITYCDMGKLKD